MKRRLIILAATLLSISLLAGCGQAETTGNAETQTTEASTESTATQEQDVTQTPEPTAEPTPAPTEEPTPEPTEEPTPAPTEEPTPEPTEEPTPAPTEEPTPEPTEEPVVQITYTYTDMTATMYATQTVNIRNLPSTDGDKVGSLSTNQEVAVTGQCNETGWYRFDYNGQTAFVSDKYLSTEPVVAQQAPPAQETAPAVSNVPNAADYAEGVWHDMGEYFFMIVPRAADGKIYTQEGFCDSINIILEERYPGNWVSSHSFDLPDGRAVFLGQKKRSSACAAFVEANS